MNADWAKGRNERTGSEGIFPRSYVAIVDEKSATGPHQPPPPPTQSNYGNMPLDVSQSGSSSTPGKESKLNANGKKFGKKMGNAAIFGAGATIGSNVSAILSGLCNVILHDSLFVHRLLTEFFNGELSLSRGDRSKSVMAFGLGYLDITMNYRFRNVLLEINHSELIPFTLQPGNNS